MRGPGRSIVVKVYQRNHYPCVYIYIRVCACWHICITDKILWNTWVLTWLCKDRSHRWWARCARALCTRRDSAANPVHTYIYTYYCTVPTIRDRPAFTSSFAPAIASAAKTSTAKSLSWSSPTADRYYSQPQPTVKPSNEYFGQHISLAAAIRDVSRYQAAATACAAQVLDGWPQSSWVLCLVW